MRYPFSRRFLGRRFLAGCLSLLRRLFVLGHFVVGVLFEARGVVEVTIVMIIPDCGLYPAWR
jgi:hypothetical protein